MTNSAITLEGASKRYYLGARGGLRHLGRELIRTRRREELWALRDVTYELPQGALLGVIGANGAGKSTLLKLIARVTTPTTGRVHVNGRLSSLIEVGAGFHNELTGRENIFLAGAIMGMSRRHITGRFDDIVGFAELERFIDTPVKRYSSGMFARLGFSVAVHTDPDILLVDEVLAVGDAAFRRRSYERVQELMREGRTGIVVSHQMSMVRRMCDLGLMLDHGRIAFAGSAVDTATYYERDFEPRQWLDPGDAKLAAERPARVEVLELTGPAGSRLLRTEAEASLRARCRIDGTLGGCVALLQWMRRDGLPVAVTTSPVLPVAESFELEWSTDHLIVAPGAYLLHVVIADAADHAIVHEDIPLALDVDGDHAADLGAATVMPSAWNIGEIEHHVDPRQEKDLRARG